MQEAVSGKSSNNSSVLPCFFKFLKSHFLATVLIPEVIIVCMILVRKYFLSESLFDHPKYFKLVLIATMVNMSRVDT